MGLHFAMTAQYALTHSSNSLGEDTTARWQIGSGGVKAFVVSSRR
jgi:hypothetical protein